MIFLEKAVLILTMRVTLMLAAHLTHLSRYTLTPHIVSHLHTLR